MKITKKILENLIKEEIEKIITEQDDGGLLEPEFAKIIIDYDNFIAKVKERYKTQRRYQYVVRTIEYDNYLISRHLGDVMRRLESAEKSLKKKKEAEAEN